MEEMDWRIFWRLVFDVVNGAPRLQLELTLWEFSAGNKRLGRSVTDLTPGITPVGTVYYVNDRAVFFGGYLDCAVDLDVEAEKLLNKSGFTLPQGASAIGEESESLRGENVNIRADVVIYEQSGKNEFPLFYFPQPLSQEIRLVERLTGTGSRVIDWDISGQLTNTGAEFEIDSSDPQHRVRVEQYKAASSEFFKLPIDSVPLGHEPTMPDHKFAGAHQHFYIGGTPNHPGGLFGEIPYLEFDPNGTCKNCPASEGNG